MLVGICICVHMYAYVCACYIGHNQKGERRGGQEKGAACIYKELLTRRNLSFQYPSPMTKTKDNTIREGGMLFYLRGGRETKSKQAMKNRPLPQFS